MWKKLYTTYVRPHFEFAVPVWCPYLKGDIAEIEKVQICATKIAHVMKGKSYEDRFKLLNLTTLEERRIRDDSIQWYKIINEIEEVWWISEPRLGHSRAGERGKYIKELSTK